MSYWRPTRKPPKRGLSRLFSSSFLLLSAGCISGFGLIIAAGFAIYYSQLASEFDLNDLGKMPERTVVYDNQNRVIGRLHGANRTIVDLEETPRFFLDALFAREDRNFFDHGGVDYYGVARAIVRNLKDREFTQGASTISMQLARNSYNLREKSIHRKLLEVAITRRIEHNLSKTRILELYVNRIFFGSGLYGLERASEAYFGKPAKEMNLSESALLAGIIRSPNRFSPFRNLEGAIQERDVVLDRMFEYDFITEEQMTIAKRNVIRIQNSEPTFSQENYAMDYVRRELNRILDLEDVEDGGLIIYTTIDETLQREAEGMIEKHLHNVEKRSGYSHITRSAWQAQQKPDVETLTTYLQGGIVVLDNNTGGVIAIVGGRDYAESKFNRAIQMQRQMGSTFKPFVYATAYEFGGLHPQALINDDRINSRSELAEFQLHRPWSPANSDGTYRGYQQASSGLVKSRNTMTVRVGQFAGITNVIEMARILFLNEAAPPSPVTYLGTFETSLLYATSAYSVFPNEGVRSRPFIISKAVDRAGNLVYRSAQVAQRLMTSGAASLTNDSLVEVMQSGTGASAKQHGWKGIAGGKTGTTNSYFDAWFIGYSNTLTCGVWVGLDRPQTIIGRGYGSTLALPIWAEVMARAVELGYLADELPTGPPRVNMPICRLSGGIPNRYCEDHGSVINVPVPQDMTQSRRECVVHRPYRPAPQSHNPPIVPANPVPQQRPPAVQPNYTPPQQYPSQQYPSHQQPQQYPSRQEPQRYPSHQQPYR